MSNNFIEIDIDIVEMNVNAVHDLIVVNFDTCKLIHLLSILTPLQRTNRKGFKLIWRYFSCVELEVNYLIDAVHVNGMHADNNDETFDEFK